MRECYEHTSHLRSPNVICISIKEIRYADDLVMMELCRADAEEVLAVLGDTSDGYGLVIHPGKTEYMVGQPTMDDNTITYRLIPIPRITSFKYLGTSINHTLDDSKEVRMRIGMGKSTLQQCKYLCCQPGNKGTAFSGANHVTSTVWCHHLVVEGNRHQATKLLWLNYLATPAQHQVA